MTTIQEEFAETAASQIIGQQNWAGEPWDASDDQIRDIFEAIHQNGNDARVFASVINHVGKDSGWNLFRDIGPSAKTTVRVQRALNS